MADLSGGAAAHSAEDQPMPPPTLRRPRVREVSSRFMSPLVQSNSTPIPSTNRSDFPRSKSALRRQPSRVDENHLPESNRIYDKLSAPVVSTVRRKQHQQAKENGQHDDRRHSDARVSSRPDTPISIGSRVVPSRYRQVPDTVSRSNSLSNSSEGCTAITAAARLWQEATSGVEKKLPRISTSSRDDMDLHSATTSNSSGSSCPNTPLCAPTATTLQRSVTDIRSSMPDVDKWRAERNPGNASRSLNFSSWNIGGGISLPPHPSTSIRSGLEMKKVKKGSNHQEDVHSLKMLSNHYLQWRFVNAKAEASMKAQRQEAEKKFHSLGGTISEIRDRVKTKRNELAVLRRIRTVTTVIESQIPNLDEWANLEEDYSNSLLITAEALLSSSVRIPVSGDVRADVGELREALASAIKVAESIGSHVQRFTSKAEEMDMSVSELAKMVSGERVLVEECGELLSKTHMSQVTEKSLRCRLIQCHKQQSTPNAEEVIVRQMSTY